MSNGREMIRRLCLQTRDAWDTEDPKCFLIECCHEAIANSLCAFIDKNTPGQILRYQDGGNGALKLTEEGLAPETLTERITSFTMIPKEEEIERAALLLEQQVLGTKWRKPLLVFSTGQVLEKLKASLDEPLRGAEMITFEYEGALWASDAAAALSLVEEHSLSYAKSTRQELLKWIDRQLERETSTSPSLRTARLFQQRGLLKHSLEEFASAKDDYERAIEIQKKEDGARHQKDLAITRYYLGCLHRSLWWWEAARKCFEDGLAAAKSSGCEHTKYYLRHQLECHCGERDAQIDYFLDKQGDFNSHNTTEYAHMAYHLGVLDQEAGDVNSALERYQTCLDLLPVANRAWRADVLHQIGTAHLEHVESHEDQSSRTASLALAKKAFDEAAEIMDTLDWNIGRAVLLNSKAMLVDFDGTQSGRSDGEIRELLFAARNYYGKHPMSDILDVVLKNMADRKQRLQCFVSYARRSKETHGQLIADLMDLIRSCGLTPYSWYGHYKRRPVEEKLQSEINGSALLVFWGDEAHRESEYCQLEIKWAAAAGLEIIEVVPDEADLPNTEVCPFPSEKDRLREVIGKAVRETTP